MRIDAHQHFWDLDKFEYAWMPPAPSRLRQNFSAEWLAPILKRNKFDGTVLVQANTCLEETHWLLELASTYGFILAVVGWVDLTDPRLPETLDQLQRHPKFKGVRHPVHDESDDEWLLRPQVLAGLRELARRDLPFDLLLRPRHLPLVPVLADKVPGLRMVIDHIAKPNIAAREMEPWAHEIRQVALLPQVYCKISGMVTEAGPNFEWDVFRPYVRHVMLAFGTDRLMFGSDWPVCLLAVDTWKQSLAVFTQSVGALPHEVRERIMGGTAAEFYRI